MERERWTYQSILGVIEPLCGSLLQLLRRKTHDKKSADALIKAAIAEVLIQVRSDRMSDPSPVRLASYVIKAAMSRLREQQQDAGTKPLPFSAGESGPSRPDSDQGLVTRVRNWIGGTPTERDRQIVIRFYLCEEDKGSICDSLGTSPLHFDSVIFTSTLREHAARIVVESGNEKAFDADAWLQQWLHESVPALDGRRPAELLTTAAGHRRLIDLLMCAQSGSYM